MPLQNLAVKLCGILQSQSDKEITAREWRLLGQEQDGSQLFSWISLAEDSTDQLNIGIYTIKTKTLQTLQVFKEKLNIIQASVNSNRSLLVYIIKTLPNDENGLKEALYAPFLLPLLIGKDNQPTQVDEDSPRQTMVQFIYGKSYKYTAGLRKDRFLLLKHLEYIKTFRCTMTSQEQEDGFEDWNMDEELPSAEAIVNTFCWAQWDCVNQVLYYIHYRTPTQSFAEGEEVTSPSDVTPTMTALQFHADLPHETVLNIPLNLPHVGDEGDGASTQREYWDQPVPLRVHDCTLDLHLLCHPTAAHTLCLAHHYLFKPTSTSDLDDSITSALEKLEIRTSGVNLAYSVSMLHHGQVSHTVVPELPWAKARGLCPAYCFYGDQLLIYIPNLFAQLLDVSPSHEPCSHIILPAKKLEHTPSLAPLVGWKPNTMVDLKTLDIWELTVDEIDLVEAFKRSAGFENKLGVLHYLIIHDENIELADELISWYCMNQGSSVDGLERCMQEFMVASAHASTRRALPPSAAPFINLLPYTHHSKLTDVRLGDISVSVSLEKLWNSSVVVLPPRQRLCQFAEDMWTRLWLQLNPATQHERLKLETVREKLAVSLQCYQPEAISRCTTPHSPLGGDTLGGCAGFGGGGDALPFFEIDICTASTREHVIAQNVRAAGLQASARGGGGAGRAGSAGGAAGAARWAAAQAEAARRLCAQVCKAAAAAPPATHSRGFSFIDDLEPSHALLLFKLLEQYYTACDGVAFPLPQGFASFFAYLGWKALPPHTFMLYVHRNVFEIQIDVLKHIISEEDVSASAVRRKLSVVVAAGAGRGARALATWPHGAAAAARAHAHARALLAGTHTHTHAHAHARTRTHAHGDRRGTTSLPSGGRLASLDTFLDLLTAKASLHELDFNLIIEATIASLQDPSL